MYVCVYIYIYIYIYIIHICIYHSSVPPCLSGTNKLPGRFSNRSSEVAKRSPGEPKQQVPEYYILRGWIKLHTARLEFGANVVIQVLFYRLSFLIRQIVRKECN